MAIQFLSSLTITGTTSVSSVSNDNSTYTGILVWDGGLLKYRTTAQILSDIGATGNTGTVTSIGLGTLDGIGGSVSNSTTNASISLENTDKGSSQDIFKSILVQGQTTLTASSNTDALTLVASGATNITTTSLTNKSDSSSAFWLSSAYSSVWVMANRIFGISFTSFASSNFPAFVSVRNFSNLAICFL